MELPLRKDLRPKLGEPEDSAWIWGSDDEVGYLLLTSLLSPPKGLCTDHLEAGQTQSPDTREG